METRLRPPDKEPTPRSWSARLCSKMTAHLATAGAGGGGPPRPGRDGRGRSGKRKREPSVSPGRGNSRRPASRRRSAGDVREPSHCVGPAAGAGRRPGLRTPGTRGRRGGASILVQGPRVGAWGARIPSGAPKTGDLRPDPEASRRPRSPPRAQGMERPDPCPGPRPRPYRSRGSIHDVWRVLWSM